MRLNLLLISFLIASPTISSSQMSAEYVGHYVFPKGAKEFPNLFQIDLLEDTTATDSFFVRVIFASAHQTDSMVYCLAKDISLRGDSLSFRTNDCLKERYEFAGRFLRKPKQFDEDYLVPVLEGTLNHFSNNRLLGRKKVAFLYDPGD